MNKTKQWVLIGAGVVVVAIIVFFAWNNKSNAPSSVNEVANPSATPPAAPQPAPSPTPPAGKPITSPGASPSPTPAYPPSASIYMTSPTANAKLVLGENNVISWNKESGISGAIYLVNAADNSVAGWVLQSVGVHQTSYTWNTRDLFLSRTSPLGKTVQAGQYLIKVVFDGGKPLATLTSPAFSVIYPSEVKIDTYTLTMQGYKFTPTALTVKQGSKLVFTNNDPVAEKLSLSNFSPMTIPSGQSFTFDTSVLTPGAYNFYSEQYPTLKTTVTVQ